MRKSEFTQRTGFSPTEAEYRLIEEAYYNFDGDKDQFCREFVKQDGEKKIYERRTEKIVELEYKVDRFTKYIEELKAALDEELEWKPCDGGTNLSQKEYEDMINFNFAEILTQEKAKEVIYDFFGFFPERVIIIEEVNTFEVNRHHRMRKGEGYTRKPVYNATDWNYIRFDCSGWSYEMVNGALRFYEH